MSTTTPTTDIADRIAAAFNAGDVTAFAACFAEDGVQTHPFFPEPLRGRAAIEAAESTLFASFDEISMTVLSVVQTGDLVAMEVNVKATHTSPLPLPDGSQLPATGERVDLVMAAFVRLDAHGQIVEAHRYQDNLAFLRALGVM